MIPKDDEIFIYFTFFYKSLYTNINLLFKQLKFITKLFNFKLQITKILAAIIKNKNKMNTFLNSYSNNKNINGDKTKAFSLPESILFELEL